MSSSWTRPVALTLALLALAPPAVTGAQVPTTHAFERVEGGDVRLFFVNRERRIALRIRNEGFVTWRSDAGFTLSYAWLSPGGDIVSEGFRTRLPHDVEPEATIALTARVKNFPSPGLYRFRWDMVHERVTWFSEKDRTPEPPRWVLVLPPIEFFLVLVIPSLAAVGGLLLWRLASRKRWRLVDATAAGADLIWVALSLFGKPFLLYAELPRRFLPEVTWSNSSAVAVPLIILLLLPRRLRACSSPS